MCYGKMAILPSRAINRNRTPIWWPTRVLHGDDMITFSITHIWHICCYAPPKEILRPTESEKRINFDYLLHCCLSGRNGGNGMDGSGDQLFRGQRRYVLRVGPVRNASLDLVAIVRSISPSTRQRREVTPPMDLRQRSMPCHLMRLVCGS